MPRPLLSKHSAQHARGHRIELHEMQTVVVEEAAIRGLNGIREAPTPP